MLGDIQMDDIDPMVEEERRRETTKLYIDFFKHFTTVSSALAVLILALRKDLNLDPALTVLGLVAMGCTLLSSLWGVTMLTILAGRSMMTANPGSFVMALVLATTFMFFDSIVLLVVPNIG